MSIRCIDCNDPDPDIDTRLCSDCATLRMPSKDITLIRHLESENTRLRKQVEEIKDLLRRVSLQNSQHLENQVNLAQYAAKLKRALARTRTAIIASGKMNGREYDSLGIEVNNALALPIPDAVEALKETP